MNVHRLFDSLIAWENVEAAALKMYNYHGQSLVAQKKLSGFRTIVENNGNNKPCHKI